MCRAPARDAGTRVNNMQKASCCRHAYATNKRFPLFLFKHSQPSNPFRTLWFTARAFAYNLSLSLFPFITLTCSARQSRARYYECTCCARVAFAAAKGIDYGVSVAFAVRRVRTFLSSVKTSSYPINPRTKRYTVERESARLEATRIRRD